MIGSPWANEPLREPLFINEIQAFMAHSKMIHNFRSTKILQSSIEWLRSVAHRVPPANHKILTWLLAVESVCWRHAVCSFSFFSSSLCNACVMTEIMNDFLVRQKFLILLKIWLKNTRRMKNVVQRRASQPADERRQAMIKWEKAAYSRLESFHFARPKMLSRV